uniref:Disease resistance RPP13-like protein 1 n=1 Tax=Vitis vinifera TaxID=29760 RepID=F6GYF5_VITVI
MFVAEAVGSSFLGVLIDKLIASPLLEYARRKKVDTTLQEWRRTLTHIEAVLDDAENKQIREKAVEVWLDDLKSLAYDIEDVVDEFDTEAKQRSLTEGHQASTSKVRKLIPTFGALDPRAMSFNKKMGEKINKITKELDAIAKRRLDFHLREGVGGVSFGIEERLPTTSLVDESRIHGRDADKEKIIELMLSDETTQLDKVSVISIVGMGGIGKTTLAQIIYKDGRVENRFEKRVWVCVSDDFDVVGITKAILESITKHPCEFKTLELLQEKLKNEMKEKNFFLVLDDVWNEKSPRWDLLQAPFSVAARGSVVLVTTRNETVASIMQTMPSYQLGQLTEEQCWLLLSQQAFKNLNSNACQNLESIGWKIAKKCKGLPLARCFAYCSIFPKDYVFDKEKLVLLWMAEGFLDGSKRGEAVEELEGLQQNQISKEIRHSSYVWKTLKAFKKVESFLDIYSLRTFLALSPYSDRCRYLVDLPTKMGRLINLRHLKINGTNLERMPIEMSRMKNLRTLTTFVVGKHTGSRVGELRDLSHLSGTLAIFKLKNVADARDALESNMKGKECLDKLELNWEDDNAIAGDSHDAASVLEKLQPHSNLKELSIGCYYGAKFSSWLGEPSFINMVPLRIVDCVKLKSFPKQGLPSLSVLEIHKCPLLKKRCQRDKGKEWRKIAHIPKIVMDAEVIVS